MVELVDNNEQHTVNLWATDWPFPPGLYSLDRDSILADATSKVLHSDAVKAEYRKLERYAGFSTLDLSLSDVLQENKDNIWQGLPSPVHQRTVRDVHNLLNVTIIAVSTDGELRRITDAAAYFRKLVTLSARVQVHSIEPAEVPMLWADLDEIEKWCASVGIVRSDRGQHGRQILNAISPASTRRRRIERASPPSRLLIGHFAAKTWDVGCTHQRSLLDKARDRLKDSTEFQALHAQWSASLDDLQRAIEENILRVIRAAIAGNLGRVYAGELPLAPQGIILGDPGIGHVPYLTDAFAQVENIIRTRRFASIGISGPRGVGKSTLVRHVCLSRGTDADVGETRDEPRQISELKPDETTRTRLGLVVSAPVRYEPRDFVVHLHQQICELILGDAAAQQQAPDADPDFERRGHRIQISLSIFCPALVVVGLILVGSAFLGAPTPPRPISQLIGVALLSGTALLAVVGALLLRRIGFPVTPRDYDFGSANAQQSALALWKLQSRRLAMGWGWILALYAGGITLSIVTPSFTKLLPSLIGSVCVAAATCGFAVRYPPLRLAIKDSHPFTASEEGMGSGSQAPPDPSLRVVARRDLKKLRYLISYSSDSSRSFKAGASSAMPVGIEAKAGRATSWSAASRTYPELVGSLQQLLIAIGQKHSFMVGIDELDKMRSAEDVELFLNEIKSIFGVAGCFFLVSVSEDAAAAFERRGVPFRDVFDSCFDEIIALRHLNLPESAKLLTNEVGWWPIPFTALCYVMSGGLPRDLLRAAREVVASANAVKGALAIAAATRRLVEKDIADRLHAVQHEVRKAIRSKEARDLYSILCQQSLPEKLALSAENSVGRLRTFADALTAPTQESFVGDKNANEPQAHAAELRWLALELAATLQLDSTILSRLGADYSADWMRQAESVSGIAAPLELLAEARRSLGVAPDLALTSLDALTSPTRDGAATGVA